MSGSRIGRAVRALRHRLDWTHAKLGSRAGCSASVVSRLESGNLRACSTETLERVVGVLGGRLVLADTRTNRRRVQQHEALFRRFDCRGRAAMAWLADSTTPVGGLLLFVPLPNVRGTHGRRAGRLRVRHGRLHPSVGAGG